MTQREIDLVAMVARACAAARRSDRISTPRLLDACRTVPDLADITAPALGRACLAAGFQPKQWREYEDASAIYSDRVRGYLVNVTGKGEQA